MGHAAGAERLVETLQVLKRTAPQVKVCTFYAFSTENWNRSQPEVEELFRVMEQTIRQFGSKLVRHNVEFRVLGEWTDPRIPASFRLLLRDLQDRTKKQRDGAEDEGDDPDHPILCVAVNYGGRNDLVQAARALARQAVAGEIDPDYITESTLSSRLSTACVPDPDLIVRTSGESRLSNFFLWNAAYSELYFCPELWPDFDSQCLDRALRWYSERKRRFGARGLGSDRRLVSEGRRHTHDQDDGDDGGLRARPGVEIPSGAAREVISASSTQKVHPSFVNGDIRRV
jgi:undecaprenyl diphosphate synthase